LGVGVAVVVFAGFLCGSVKALKIRDVARLKNESTNTLYGYGLVVGLKGTGDGDNSQTVKRLAALLRNLGDPNVLDRELKNNNNVAFVHVSVTVPEQGAHAGQKLDVIVSSLGSAKSLRGGQLFDTLMLFSWNGRTIPMAVASGECRLDDESHQTRARIVGGAVMIEDLLSEEIKDGKFTLVLRPESATPEMAAAVAAMINEDAKVDQTGGKAIAFPIDSTSVDVFIPAAELGNVTRFVAHVRGLELPDIPEPAKVMIDTKKKTITFTREVELSPATIMHGGMTIEIKASSSSPEGTKVQNTRLRDLMAAFEMYRISADGQIAIVRELSKAGVLKAVLEVD